MKVACDVCEEIIDPYFMSKRDWLKVEVDGTCYNFCPECAKKFWKLFDGDEDEGTRQGN